ncbi:MAG: colicin V production protein [Bacteroidetes bacterium]|nr:MAG: colicin V production protein [Bacteroidota bacterium]PIE88352.1 MAG: colicin V production protein [Bacteroidota bacterium]
MNWLDIVILIPLLLFAFRGLKNGIIMEIFTLIALILGIWGALEFSFITEAYLIEQFQWNNKYLGIIALIITFTLVAVGVYLVGKIIQKLSHAVALGALDKLLGFLFGVMKGLLILALIAHIYHRFDPESHLIDEEVKEASFCYPILSEISKEMARVMDEQTLPDIHKEKEKLDNMVKETFDI